MPVVKFSKGEEEANTIETSQRKQDLYSNKILALGLFYKISKASNKIEPQWNFTWSILKQRYESQVNIKDNKENFCKPPFKSTTKVAQCRKDELKGFFWK